MTVHTDNSFVLTNDLPLANKLVIPALKFTEYKKVNNIVFIAVTQADSQDKFVN